MATKTAKTRRGLEAARAHRNLSPTVLVEHAVRRGEGKLTQDGSFVGLTSPHTGRSPDDKFVVREPTTEGQIWWGKVNVALEPEKFERLHQDVRDHLGKQELYVSDLWAEIGRAHV